MQTGTGSFAPKMAEKKLINERNQCRRVDSLTYFFSPELELSGDYISFLCVVLLGYC